MTPERHRRISDVFQEIVELPAPQRAARLAAICAGDDEIRREVESLLEHHHERADEFADGNVGVGRKLVAEPNAPSAGLPTHIGRFRILRRIGEGGMGVVFEAEQDNPRRIVALKVIRAGLASDSVVRRFRHEAEVLGRLQHVGIADLYDAGVAETPLGRQPYFAMQLIQGRPLIDYAKEQQLDTRARLTLFARVCDAVEYAHQRGIIHRDLKPANILVDDAGRPKVLDFGVARVTDDNATLATMQTATGQVIGTLPYMSPEQISGKASDVDTRSDVYSLGVTLYELLAERLPYQVSNCTLPEAARIIADVEPTHLSTIDRRFRGDVDTIVTKALQKERRLRYQSVADFAADIRRYLSDEPVLARPPSAMYQIRKFARRNKALVASVLGVFLALVVGLLGMWWFAAGESRQKATAESASREARRLAYRVSVNAAADAISDHSLSVARKLLDEAPAELRGWEWLHLSTRLDDSYRRVQGIPPPGGWLQVRADGNLVQRTVFHVILVDVRTGTISKQASSSRPVIAVTRDGTRVAAVAELTRITLHDLDSGAVESLADMTGVSSLDFNSEGTLLAAGGANRELRLYDLRTRTLLWETTLPRLAFDLSFSPDGMRLAARDITGFVVVALRDGRLEHNFDVPGFQRFTASVWSHDGQLVFSREMLFNPNRNFITPIRLADGARLPSWPEHHRELSSFLLTPDGATGATGYAGGLLRLHDLPGGAIRREFTVEGGAVVAPAFSPDGKLLAYGQLNGMICLEDRVSGRHVRTLRGQDSPSSTIVFSGDGNTLFSSAIDGVIRAWDISSSNEKNILYGHESYVYPVVFSPDGTTLASGSWDGTIRLWDVASQRALAVLTGHTGYVRSLAFSPNGRFLVSTTVDGREAFLWDRSTETHVPIPLRSPPVPDTPAFFKDSRRIWLPGDLASEEHAWNIETGEVETISRNALRELADDRVSPDGRWMARIVGSESSLVIVSLQDSGTARKITTGVARATFNRAGDKVLTAMGETPVARPHISVLDAATGAMLLELAGHIGDVFDIRFSPDGKRFASCGRDGSIRIWDGETFDQLVSLRGHTDYVWSVAWSPDGRTLASGSGDGTIRLWTTRQ
ncbi:MAG: hypothetical protein AMXMBFR47_14990 [Planctomycetota bacterium]